MEIHGLRSVRTDARPNIASQHRQTVHRAIVARQSNSKGETYAGLISSASSEKPGISIAWKRSENKPHGSLRLSMESVEPFPRLQRVLGCMHA